jgi:hypothetical protein
MKVSFWLVVSFMHASIFAKESKSQTRSDIITRHAFLSLPPFSLCPFFINQQHKHIPV